MGNVENACCSRVTTYTFTVGGFYFVMQAAPESDDVVRLKDMFPDVPPARIKDLLNKSSVSEVVDMLVEQNGDKGLKHVISTSTSSDEDLPIIDLTVSDTNRRG